MYMEKFKNNMKEIFLLLLIFLIIGGFCYLRYFLYKQKKEALRPYSEQLTSQSVEEINAAKSTLGTRVKGFFGNVVNIDGTARKSSSDASNDDSNTLIHFDVSSEYDSFIFDDSLFMYEGKQNGSNVKTVLDTIIKGAQDDFYSNPKVTIKNFGVSDTTIEDGGEYISRLVSVKNQINESSTYNISFGYSKLKAYVNEVIIEK